MVIKESKLNNKRRESQNNFLRMEELKEVLKVRKEFEERYKKKYYIDHIRVELKNNELVIVAETNEVHTYMIPKIYKGIKIIIKKSLIIRY